MDADKIPVMLPQVETKCVFCKSIMLPVKDGLWQIKNGPCVLTVAMVVESEPGKFSATQVCWHCIKKIAKQIDPPNKASKLRNGN